MKVGTDNSLSDDLIMFIRSVGWGLPKLVGAMTYSKATFACDAPPCRENLNHHHGSHGIRYLETSANSSLHQSIINNIG